MRHRSKKRQKQYVDERIPVVKEMLEENPICMMCWRAPAVDVHELVSRARGGSITDKSNLVTLCREHHDFITQNPAWAHAHGWSRHSWERT